MEGRWRQWFGLELATHGRWADCLQRFGPDSVGSGGSARCNLRAPLGLAPRHSASSRFGPWKRCSPGLTRLPQRRREHPATACTGPAPPRRPARPRGGGRTDGQAAVRSRLPRRAPTGPPAPQAGPAGGGARPKLYPPPPGRRQWFALELADACDGLTCVRAGGSWFWGGAGVRAHSGCHPLRPAPSVLDGAGARCVLRACPAPPPAPSARFGPSLRRCALSLRAPPSPLPPRGSCSL